MGGETRSGSIPPSRRFVLVLLHTGSLELYYGFRKLSDTNLATYIDPADVTLPCSIALSSSRINFLSSVLYDKAVEASEVINRGIDKVDFLREWAASIVRYDPSRLTNS